MQPNHTQTDAWRIAGAWILKTEGGLSMDPDDSGNWTGGRIGEGELNGTNYGISAAQYPDIDIRGLTTDEAIELYRVDYWGAYRCGELPPALGLFLFDSVVQHRPKAAVGFLQRAVGTTTDGIIGPITLASTRRRSRSYGAAGILGHALADRAEYYHGIIIANSRRAQYATGWFRRLFELQQFIFENGLVE